MPRFFEQKLSLTLLLLAITLLFLPKINLIHLDAGETAGLRIDDAILFLLGALLMWSHALSHQKLYPLEGWLVVLTLFSFFSFLCNQLLFSLDWVYGHAKIFYTIRLVEYFMFFYIGAIGVEHFKLQTIIRTFFFWNLFIIILQKMSILGAFAVHGYYKEASARVFGIASFPSEMGLMLNLMFCYMIWDASAPSRFVRLFKSPLMRDLLHSFYLYWMFILFGLLIVLTGNRISVLALLICFFARFIQNIRLRSLSSLFGIVVVIPLLLLVMGLFIIHSEGIYERSAGLLSFKNLELAYTVTQNIDIKDDLYQTLEESSTPEGYDLSWWIRIHKWLFAIKSFVLNPACYLQGLGPGFHQAALDGGFLRILTEYGVIGSFLFWKFFSCLFRLNLQTKWMINAFLINMIFFDAYLAYKTMSLLFFICGYTFENQSRAI